MLLSIIEGRTNIIAIPLIVVVVHVRIVRVAIPSVRRTVLSTRPKVVLSNLSLFQVSLNDSLKGTV